MLETAAAADVDACWGADAFAADVLMNGNENTSFMSLTLLRAELCSVASRAIGIHSGLLLAAFADLARLRGKAALRSLASFLEEVMVAAATS